MGKFFFSEVVVPKINVGVSAVSKAISVDRGTFREVLLPEAELQRIQTRLNVYDL